MSHKKIIRKVISELKKVNKKYKGRLTASEDRSADRQTKNILRKYARKS